MKKRYLAIWLVDGEEKMVLPRSKNRHTFVTPEIACHALERKARHHPRNSRGLVKESMTGEIVLTIAL